jgi:hypothetical protein
LRKLGSSGGPHPSTSGEDEFDVDGPSLKATAGGVAGRRPARQSSAEVEAALAWAEKAALEQSLTDTQRELAELRHPPEPEGGGFFSAVFGGSKKSEQGKDTRSPPVACA